MNTKKILTAVLLAWGSLCASGADDHRSISNSGSAPFDTRDLTPPVVWQATLGDNMKVTILVRNIAAVALHPYYLNGAVMVSELTIDTMGSNTIRFYCIHEEENISSVSDPRTALGTAKKEATRAITGQQADAVVPSVKFPEGTYGHTIEYQVASPEVLDKLYKSITNAIEKLNSQVIRENFKAKTK